MSLDTVAEDVKDDARDRAERIRSEADARAEAIVAEAEADAEETRDEREREIERRIDQEREQTLSSAKLEAKQKRLEGRRVVLEDTREEAELRVAALDGERREELTRELLDDAADEFSADDTVRISGRADDADLLESLVAEYEGFEYAGEVECLGGVVAESDASRVRVNNTFDSILDGVWETQLQAISTRLFDR